MVDGTSESDARRPGGEPDAIIAAWRSRGAKRRRSPVKASTLSPEELAKRPLIEYPGWERWSANKRRCLDMLPKFRTLRATSLAAGVQSRYMDTERNKDPLYAAAIEARLLVAPDGEYYETEMLDLMQAEAREFLYDLIKKAKNANNKEKLGKGDETRIKLGIDAAKQISGLAAAPRGKTKLKKQHEVLGGKTERVDVQDDESASDLNTGIGLTFLHGGKT